MTHEPHPPGGHGPAEGTAPASESGASLAARRSAQRFRERLSARTPETERYREEREIARGGMGAIVAVWDDVLQRQIAMKVLLEREVDEEDPESQDSATVLLARFLDEAQVTGQLDHPGIVPVHDMGVDAQGRVWFTMRLVRGRNLEEILGLVERGEEGWSRTRAVQVLLRVCEAMAFAHSKGIVHRDLKPANVMVGSFGETYVMDWGLARVAGQPELRHVKLTAHDGTSVAGIAARGDESLGGSRSPHLTLAGSIVGTPAYMPPEQARGEIAAVDERSDVYAAGAMLYHLLAAHRPYARPGTRLNALDLLRAVVAGPPDAITAPEAPPELVAVCEKAMAREKDARYPSMRALAEDLQAYLEGRVVRAHRTGARAELAKWIGRNRLAAAALAAAGVLAVAGSITIAWVTHRSNVELELARDAAVVQSYGSNLSAASASLSLDAVEEARRRLAACEPALRGWEWEHLALAAAPHARKLHVGDGAIGRIAWSRDGRELALRVGERFEVWDVARGARRAELAGPPAEFKLAAWSPDGRWLATAGESGKITLWDAHELKQARVLAGHGTEVRSVRFAHDGGRLYSTAGDVTMAGFTPGPATLRENGRIAVWDVASGARLATLGAEGPMIGNLALDDAGDRLLCSDADGTVRVFDVRSGAVLASRRFPGTLMNVIAFEGRDVLLGALTLGLQRWDPELQTVLASREFPEALAGVLTDWKLGPHLIAGRRPGGAVRIFDRHDLSEVAELRVADEEAALIALDPAGRWLACGGEHGTVSLWNPEIPGARSDIALAEWNLRGLEFSPDGERLIAYSSAGRIVVLDAFTGVPIATHRLLSGRARALALSGDGTRMLVLHEKRSHLLSAADLSELAEVDGDWTIAARSGDGFVLGAQDGTVAWLGATAERPAAGAQRHAAPVTALTASADGAWTASGAQDGSVIVWDRRAGRQRALAGSAASIAGLVFDAGGRRLTAASASGRLLRWDPETGALQDDRAALDVPFVALEIAPDGRRLFTNSEDGLVRVWDGAGLTNVATLAQSGARVERIALSRDGRRLACELDSGGLRVLESRAEDLHDERRARHIETQRRARGLVTLLAHRLGSVGAVEEAVTRDTMLPEDVRAATAGPVQALREDAKRAHRQSWRIVLQRDEGQSAYRAALAQAERAWKLEPEKPEHREALALALLRAGETERALELLRAAEKGPAAPAGRPFTVAIRALGDARLGDADRARDEVRAAREGLRRESKLRAQELRQLLSEVEAAAGIEAPK